MGLSQKPSTSLPLNYASAVIDTTANVASLLFSQWQHRSWASTWLLVTAQTTNTASGYSRTTNPNKTLAGSPDRGHHCGLRWPLRSVWPTTAAQPTDSHMAFDSNMSHGHQHCRRTSDPDMAPSGSTDPDITMALDGSTNHTDQNGPWQ